MKDVNDRSIQMDLIKTIEDIDKDNKMIVELEEGMTKPIAYNYETRIRQTDSLNPLLFNIRMNEIIKKIKKTRGYKMGFKGLKIICYTDDATPKLDQTRRSRRKCFEQPK